MLRPGAVRWRLAEAEGCLHGGAWSLAEVTQEAGPWQENLQLGMVLTAHACTVSLWGAAAGLLESLHVAGELAP